MKNLWVGIAAFLFMASAEALEYCGGWVNELDNGSREKLYGPGITIRGTSASPWEVGLGGLLDTNSDQDTHYFFTIGKFWTTKFGPEVGFGVGYFFPPQKKIRNMSSRANFSINLGYTFGKKRSPKLYARGRIHHFSNGELREPNRGLNTFQGHLCTRRGS